MASFDNRHLAILIEKKHLATIRQRRCGETCRPRQSLAIPLIASFRIQTVNNTSLVLQYVKRFLIQQRRRHSISLDHSAPGDVLATGFVDL